MNQVVDIRSYQLNEGAAERFERIVVEQTMPLLRAAGTDVSNAVAPLVFAPAEQRGIVHPAGQPGDFDFLSGEWTIRHRRLIAATGEWDAFEGEASCWSILGGVASVEELRIPVRGFSGMGLRLLDRERQVWSDFWMNGNSGVLMTPGTEGHFENGAGIFSAREFDNGHPLLVRGTWDNISASTCRWQQATSRDAGLSWQTNWIMDWSRRDANA